MINKFVSSLDYTGIAEGCTLKETFAKLTTSLATDNEAIHQKILEYRSLLPKSSIHKLDIDQLAAIEAIADQVLPDYATEVIKLKMTIHLRATTV